MALNGSNPAKSKAKTFVWRSQDLKAILGAKLDDVGDLGDSDRAIDLLHGQHEVLEVDGQIFLPEDDGRGVATLGVGSAAEDKGHFLRNAIPILVTELADSFVEFGKVRAP